MSVCDLNLLRKKSAQQSHTEGSSSQLCWVPNPFQSCSWLNLPWASVRTVKGDLNQEFSLLGDDSSKAKVGA